jgi:sulfate/thiosulfate transport system permease protein
MPDVSVRASGTLPGARSGAGRRPIIGLALGWLGLVLVLPFAAVFYSAFAEGVGAFFAALSTPEFLHAAWLTLVAMTAALAFNLVFGIAAAWAVARTTLPGRRTIETLLDLPVAVSPVVAGLMFLLVFGRQGWLGPALDAINVKVVFALPGILIATIFVTMPFVAKEVLSVLRETGDAEEEAAATLGAGPIQTFAHIVVPNIRWAVFYGLVLTAARAVGEFGAVSVLSGNLIGQTQTLPLYIEQAYSSYQTTAAFAAAVPLTLLALVTIVATKVLEWLSSRKRSRSIAEETA